MITIDELDNMDYTEQQSLDEALSEGQLSVDKANVHATLNARCSALMAANPEQGRFDPYEPLTEQFAMPKELLDRCDLVFPFEDRPDDELDEAIVDTILDTHAPTEAAADGGSEPVESAGFIEADLFRKYVAYARRNYDPTLTDDAKAKLKDWYLKIRQTSEEDRIAINTRMFEGAIRLSQASARAKLSETVEPDDADRAIGLVQSMLNQLGLGEGEGGFDVDMINLGAPSKSQQQVRDYIKKCVDELAHEGDDDGAKRADILERAAKRGDYDKDRVDGEIDKLATKGELYQPQDGRFRTS